MAVNTWRAQRDVEEHFEKGATNFSVGPGSYSSGHLDSTSRQHSQLVDGGDNRQFDAPIVPFSTLAERPHVGRQNPVMFTTQTLSVYTPGPGRYNLRAEEGQDVASDRRPTSAPAVNLSKSAFRSRGPRMTPFLDVPGATEFNPSTILKNPGPGQYSHSTPMMLRMPEGDGRWHSKSMPALTGEEPKKTAPSIGGVRAEHVVRFAGRSGDTSGPGDYELDIPQNMRPHRRETSLNNTHLDRNLFEPTVAIDNILPPRSNPSPSKYDTSRKFDKGITNALQTSVKRGPSSTNESSTALQSPGPAAYCELERSPVLPGGLAEKPKQSMQLRSRAAREGLFRPALTQCYTDPDFIEVPGPGTYSKDKVFTLDDKRRGRSDTDLGVNAVEARCSRKWYGVHAPQHKAALMDTDGTPLCGFDSTDWKPCLKPGKQTTPSPDVYNSTDSIGQSMNSKLKERVVIGTKGIFGPTTDRSRGFALGPSNEDVPAPGTYHHTGPDLARAVVENLGAPCRSQFASQTLRFTDPAQSPGPGNADCPERVPDYRSRFRKPVQEHLSFGSGGCRWSPNEVFVGTPFNPQPGPGEYQPKMGAKHIRGSRAMCRGSRGLQPPRTEAKVAGNMGPGDYEVQGSLTRKTFNNTIETASKLAQGRLSLSESEASIHVGGAGGGSVGSKVRMRRSPQSSSTSSLFEG